MFLELDIQDHLGDWWTFLMPGVYRKNKRGLTELWVYVARGPKKLTEPPYMFQEIPLPVFTEWWEDDNAD